MVRAVLNDGFKDATFRKDDAFGFDVPVSCPGVDSNLLNPRELWADKAEYDETVAKLAADFRESFGRFASNVSPEVANAGPAPR